MKNNPRKTILFFLIPLFAILACNAPIEEFFPAETPTIIKPTIGPPPTLTPLSLEESDFVIVTQTPKPTATATEVLPTSTPAPTEPPPPTPTLIPTVTRNPAFGGSQNQTATPEPTPEEPLDPLELATSIQWEDGAELEKQNSYSGRLNFSASGGSGVYIFFVEGLQLASDGLNITVDECEDKVYRVTVQSADTAPLEQVISVQAPCFDIEETIAP